MARGRKAGFHMGPEHRDKIKNSNILRNLIKFAEGDPTCPIDYQQAQVGLGLLKKVLPDYSTLTVEGAGENGEHIIKAYGWLPPQE